MAILFQAAILAAGSPVLTVALVVFLAVDMFRVNTFRLLSENLLVPLIAVLLWAVLKAESTRRLPWFVRAGAVCGLCALTRPNAVFFGPAIASVIVLHPWHPQRFHRLKLAAAFIAAFAIVCSLLASAQLRRDWGHRCLGGAAAGRVAAACRGGQAGVPAFDWLAATARFYGVRTAFAVGIPTFLEPAYRASTALALDVDRRRSLFVVRRQTSSHVLGAAPPDAGRGILLPLIAVAHISNYGFRMVMPVVLLLLPLAVKGAELALLASDDRAATANPTR